MRRLISFRKQGTPDYCIFKKAKKQERRCYGKGKANVVKSSMLASAASGRQSPTGGEILSAPDQYGNIRKWISLQPPSYDYQDSRSQAEVISHRPYQERMLVGDAGMGYYKISGQKKGKGSYRSKDSAIRSDMTGPSKKTGKSGKSKRSVQFAGDV
ncbi:MAG: hypothetical protein Q9213_001139 [Squamulea squamosa]